MTARSTLLVTRTMTRPRSEQNRNEMFAAALDAVVFEVPDGWGERTLVLPSLDAFDAVVVLLRHEDLFVAPPIDWMGFDGLRVWYEADATADYWDLWRSRTSGQYVGAFEPMFRRHGFDHMIVTGSESKARFADQGIPVTWLPKGYDPDAFHLVVDPAERSGCCTYGSAYFARAAMLSDAKRRRISVEHIRADYRSLNDRLNAYASGLVCNMIGIPRGGRIGRAIRKVNRGALLDIRPGPEVMMKNFETAAAGCAVFADWIEDLGMLGFEDGVSFVAYRSFDELWEKLDHYGRNVTDLVAIARAGEELCRTRHTWACRADSLKTIVTSLLAKA